jgi:hypothetical protein
MICLRVLFRKSFALAYCVSAVFTPPVSRKEISAAGLKLIHRAHRQAGIG